MSLQAARVSYNYLLHLQLDANTSTAAIHPAPVAPHPSSRLICLISGGGRWRASSLRSHDLTCSLVGTFVDLSIPHLSGNSEPAGPTRLSTRAGMIAMTEPFHPS